MDLALYYARRGKTAAWRYVATAVVGLGMAMLIGGVLFAVLLISRLAPPDLAEGLTDPGRPEVFLTGTGAVFGLIAVGLLLAARWIQGKRPGDLIGAWSWNTMARGAGVWLLALTVGAVIDALLAPGSIKLTASAATLQLAGLALVGLVPQVFAEELVFRGFLTQGVFLALKREWPAAIVSGLIFGALHIPNGAPQAVSATLFGIFSSLIAIRLGGLAFTFGAHLANNLYGAVVIVSSSDVFRGMPGVFVQNAPQLMWWDVLFSNAVLLLLALFCRRLVPCNLGRRDNPHSAQEENSLE
jgi:membrane protease YdiL (CAAX protease family)